jgi:hypothetical protein
LVGRTRGLSEVLRLEVLEVELRDALGHGIQNIFSRALNKIRKPTTAGEIVEILKGDLDQGDRPSKEKTLRTGCKMPIKVSIPACRAPFRSSAIIDRLRTGTAIAFTPEY